MALGVNTIDGYGSYLSNYSYVHAYKLQLKSILIKIYDRSSVGIEKEA